MKNYNTIIIAAAYTADLFHAAGFKETRNQKMVDGQPLILRAIHSYFSPPGKLAVAINREEEHQDIKLGPIISRRYPSAEVFYVGSNVQGALISALIASENMPLDEPILIANGDSFLQDHISDYFSDSTNNNEGAKTLCFESSNPRWSYLALNSEGQLAEVAEKRVISNLATTGAFLFAKASDFIEAAEWVLINRAQTQGRYFVSTALNFLISRGMKVTYDVISRDHYSNYSFPADFVEQAK